MGLEELQPKYLGDIAMGHFVIVKTAFLFLSQTSYSCPALFRGCIEAHIWEQLKIIYILDYFPAT